jgi:hypothetical protein
LAVGFVFLAFSEAHAWEKVKALPQINADDTDGKKQKPLTTKDTKGHKGKSEKPNPHH